MLKYAAVIPAAGLSSRMKDFKPLLPLDGKAMIDHEIDTFEKAGIGRIVIVAGHNAQRLISHLAKRNIQIVINADYAQSHMLDSIKLGLAALENEYEGVYITPGDVPLFSVETVSALAKSEKAAVRPVCDGKGGHPVYLKMEAARFVQHYEGNNGLRGALDQLHLADLCFEDYGAVLDADTPEDFQKLQRLADNLKKYASPEVGKC